MVRDWGCFLGQLRFKDTNRFGVVLNYSIESQTKETVGIWSEVSYLLRCRRKKYVLVTGSMLNTKFYFNCIIHLPVSVDIAI